MYPRSEILLTFYKGFSKMYEIINPNITFLITCMHVFKNMSTYNHSYLSLTLKSNKKKKKKKDSTDQGYLI